MPVDGNGWITLGTTSTYTLSGAAQDLQDIIATPWLTTGTSTGSIALNWLPLATSITTGTWTTSTWTTVSGASYARYRDPYRLDPGEEQREAAIHAVRRRAQEQEYPQPDEAAWLEEDARRHNEAEARRIARAEQYAAQINQQQQANDRAHGLLLAHLDAQQKRDVLEFGWFELRSDKGRRWRIRMEGIVGNVDLMPSDGGSERMASFCAHSPGELPHSDHFLAQKLVLETDEESFLQVANVHWRDHGIPAEQFWA